MTRTFSPETFDMLARKIDRLWGARTIAAFLGVSEDTVRRWAREDEIPIHNPRRGTYFASRVELERWLRKKPAA